MEDNKHLSAIVDLCVKKQIPWSEIELFVMLACSDEACEVYGGLEQSYDALINVLKTSDTSEDAWQRFYSTI